MGGDGPIDVPSVIAQMANDGLHNQSRQRGCNPQQWDFILARTECLKYARHVASLEGKSKLNPQKAEAHVPDFPKSQFALFHDGVIDAQFGEVKGVFVCNIH